MWHDGGVPAGVKVMRSLASLTISLGLLVLLTAPVSADLTFAQWVRGPADKRAIYTAGVMATVGVYAEVLGFVDRWEKCLATLRLSYGAIGEGAIEFAKKKGGMDDQPAPSVLIVYMNERCGFTVLKQK
jgi:hypothetical protein